MWKTIKEVSIDIIVPLFLVVTCLIAGWCTGWLISQLP